MRHARSSPGHRALAPRGRLAPLALILAISGSTAIAADRGPFAGFTLPEAWQARFWDDPDTKALLTLAPKALAALVPAQAGLRCCRCPSCDADEASDPLVWSATKPASLTCRRCGQSFPNAKIPAKVDGKIPEEAVEVLPGLTHHYPYHAPAADLQLYPDERLYLDAKRDYETREALSRAALYAAYRHRDPARSAPPRETNLARFAAVLILRFAQVYPAYATHFDQPGQPKFLQRGDLAPPYRRGYRTGKWEWTASLDVPLNLVTAYALIRDDPVWAEVARDLDDPNPKRTIEHGFFRASAEFVRRQPEEFDEMSLQAYRGLFAVARLLDDEALMTEARDRLTLFTERGFFHDGYWRQGDARAHRRVLQQLDGWIERLAGPASPDLAATTSVPMLDLIRRSGSIGLVDAKPSEVQQVSWPAPPRPSAERKAVLLGGVGLARLSVGGPKDGLDIELRDMGNLGSPHVPRQALRVAVGGRTVLDDLDDLAPTRDGWDLATASHNTIVVDGLNQRETPLAARQAAGAGQFLFFAADPDFQVVALDDPLAYPRSTARYRQVVVAAAGPLGRHGVSVFQVRGGLQHDQLFHGPSGGSARWTPSIRSTIGPESLLPANIPYVPNTHADDGRWFVQAYGEFRRLSEAHASAPFSATLAESGYPGVRVHALGSFPIHLFAGLTPDPTAAKPPAVAAEAGEGRASLVLRRRSPDGATLASTFVTVFEPVGAGAGLRSVGRVASGENVVVLALTTADGDEHLVLNLQPGTPQTIKLKDGRLLTTDGLAVRVSATGLHLAGGTHARLGPVEVGHVRLAGRVVRSSRLDEAGCHGAFEVEGDASRFVGIEGRTLLIRHGDDSVRGWTIQGVGPATKGKVKLYVREEAGFLIDEATQEARYYQFPRVTVPAPHHYSISRITRTEPVSR